MSQIHVSTVAVRNQCAIHAYLSAVKDVSLMSYTPFHCLPFDVKNVSQIHVSTIAVRNQRAMYACLSVVQCLLLMLYTPFH